MEEPQKKIFFARKTMRMSDRQQLEALHNTLTAHSNSSSRPQTPLVNGTHTQNGSKRMKKDKETGKKSPASPSSHSSRVPSRSASLSLKATTSARSTSPSVSDKKAEQKKTSTDQALNGKLPMDTDSTSLDNGSAEEKNSTSTPSTKKRFLSPVEGKDGWKDGEIKEKRDGKRARVKRGQLEAQLELKITANAGSRLKLEKVVQQLVEERLRVLQLTVFDRNLQELKDRMEKIDAAFGLKSVQHTGQATLINHRCPAAVSVTNEQLPTVTQRLLNLKAKVGWLEARLNEKALPSHPPTVDQSTSTDREVDVELFMPTKPEIQSACQESIENQTSLLHETAGDHSTLASGHLDDADFSFSAAPLTPLSDSTIKVRTDLENVTSVDSATQLGRTNHSPHRVRRTLIRGEILPDVILNRVSIKKEKKLYLDSAGSGGRPRADRFAVCLFRRLITPNLYHIWAGTVNYDGSRGKNALPSNLRQAISDAVARKFHPTARDWKQIRDKINELLRKKRLHFPLK